MATVSAVNWQPSGGPTGLVQRSAATWCHAVFIAWTGWTLTML